MNSSSPARMLAIYGGTTFLVYIETNGFVKSSPAFLLSLTSTRSFLAHPDNKYESRATVRDGSIIRSSCFISISVSSNFLDNDDHRVHHGVRGKPHVLLFLQVANSPMVYKTDCSCRDYIL
ncbi:hypothetical protein COOONC_15715 [Cooperia oncophora]